MSDKPSTLIVREFGEDAEPILMSGGEGLSYRVGQLVLKPVQNAEQAIWNAELLAQLPENGFRLLHARKSIHGEWVYNGWQAFQYLEGEETKGNWIEKISVSRLFHKELRRVKRPDFIGKRENPWEQADLMVWSETPLKFHAVIQDITIPLIALIQPIEIENQIIHGDMTGNILFHPTLPPAIIDFSPYWRPAEYATAIIVVDAIVWEGAPNNLLEELENTQTNNQLLIRAALWRMKTSELFSKLYGESFQNEIKSFQYLISLLVKRVRSQRD